MRELTQKQIDNAPERFDAYYEDGNGSLRLINTKSMETCSANFLPRVKGVSFFDKDHYSLKTCSPIPRKPFDISEYEFSDSHHLTSCYIDDCGDLVIELTNDPSNTYLTKKDVTAIAKHFGVTAEDLK